MVNMARELEVTKKVRNKPMIKRVELEYGDMNYIIVNLLENVIDVDGKLWEYQADDEIKQKIFDLVWDYAELDEFDFWPDKSKDHKPMSPKWRLAFYDEFDTYYHKSGATHYPENFMKLVDLLKNLK